MIPATISFTREWISDGFKLGGVEMEKLLFAAASLTQDAGRVSGGDFDGLNDTLGEASKVGVFDAVGVTATIFSANNASNSMIGINDSNDVIMFGANVRLWDGRDSDSLTLATAVGAFASASDVGVTLSNCIRDPAGVVDLLNGSEGYLSAAAHGPLTSDGAGEAQLALGGGHATDFPVSVWNFG